MSDFEQKLKNYQNEVDNDLKINDMTLSDKSFEIPQRKHYWATKLILEKIELSKLEKTKKKLEKEVLARQTNEMPVSLTKTGLKGIVNNTQTMQTINQQIETQKLIVEYLEKVEKIFAFITNDIKNIIEVKQMELM